MRVIVEAVIQIKEAAVSIGLVINKCKTMYMKITEIQQI